MIHLGTDVNIDLSTSCTKDQAVMKLLGWSQGIFTQKQIEFPKEGLWLNQLSAVSHHTMNLTEELKELHERARQEYLGSLPPEVYEDNFDPEKHFTSPEAINFHLEKAQNLENMGKLIVRAHELAMDIEDELEKGDNSILRIDKDATEKAGVTHITLRSFEKWRVRYDTSTSHPRFQAERQAVVDVPLDSRSSPETIAVSSDESVLDTISSNKKKNFVSLLDKLSEPLKSDPEKTPKGEIGLYITLALAVEAVVKKFPNYGDKDRAPNISRVADFIAGAHQDPDGKPLIEGQGLEMIRKRLSKAMELRKKSR